MKSVGWKVLVAVLAVQLAGCASMSKLGNDFGEWMDQLQEMVVGSSTDTSSGTRDEAIKKYGYRPSQEQRIEVDGVTNTPSRVAPGDTLESVVRYTVLAAENVQTVRLTVTRAVIVDREAIQLGQQRQWESRQGSHTSSVKLTIPKNMPKGDFTLVTTIFDGKTTKTAKTTFSVI
jgi:hypothetical protein